MGAVATLYDTPLRTGVKKPPPVTDMDNYLRIPDLSNIPDPFKMRLFSKTINLNPEIPNMLQPAQNQAVRKPELLAPGGSFHKCRVALLYGADAVYAAGKNFGLRSFAHNLDNEELAGATFLAHRLGKKIYITVNVFAREADLGKLPAYLEYLDDLGVDALIVSDPGVLVLARTYAPRLPLHLSTQANTTNSLSIRFWRDQGVSRINLARELTFSELREIAKNTDIDLEIFVHGAMCMSYSGRCLLSAFLNHRSANSGACTQPCRWSYSLVEEKRPGQYFPVQEDGRGTYIFNSKDLCLIEDTCRLADLGIASMKIEGRMKGVLYLASVTRAYRQAIDRCAARPEAFDIDERWIQDLKRVSHRPYTKGLLYEDAEQPASNIEPEISYIQTHTLAGIVGDVGSRTGQELNGNGPFPQTSGNIWLQARSRLGAGQILEFIYPDGSSRFHTLDRFEGPSGNLLTDVHPNGWIRFGVDFPVFPFQVVRTERKC